MGEDQITALPPEFRQMVMTGTTAMMNNNMSNMPNSMNAGMNVTGPSPAAMMNPQMMMEMSSMMMNMGNMDMAQMMQQMQQQAQDGSAGPGGAGGMGVGGMGGMGVGVGAANEQVQPGGPGGMMMQDGPYPGGPGGMMNMGMGGGGDFGMQVRWT